MVYAKMLFELANVRPKTTGLPMVIWISSKGRTKHGCRIKVQRRHGNAISLNDWISVTVENEPRTIGKTPLSAKDFALVSQFIGLNRKTLLAYWNLKLDTVETVALIKPIEDV